MLLYGQIIMNCHFISICMYQVVYDTCQYIKYVMLTSIKHIVSTVNSYLLLIKYYFTFTLCVFICVDKCSSAVIESNSYCTSTISRYFYSNTLMLYYFLRLLLNVSLRMFWVLLGQVQSVVLVVPTLHTYDYCVNCNLKVLY